MQRGKEFIEPRPMDWGTNLTMIGAIRRDGWLALGTIWGAANKENFTAWVKERLAPKLRPGDIVVMDNLRAHKDLRVEQAVRARGGSLVFLPPYSPDLNPIEPAWALIKKRLKAVAPRTPSILRHAALNARHVVKRRHCSGFYRRAGYHQLN